MKDSIRSNRRQLLRIGAAVGGGLVAGREGLAGENTPGQLGTPLGPYGERSPFEKAVRWMRDSKTPETGSSFTPLQDSVGTLTPSSLHYERHHAGIPTIDPAQHRLVIHGMVNRPLSLSVAEIKRLPSGLEHWFSNAAATVDRSGRPKQDPMSKEAAAWSVAANGPESHSRYCSRRLVSSPARPG
jgi:sulfane dehydrogenase subunit SoxC